MQVIIKEIINRTDFEPFSCLHLISEIRCGALKLFEKIEHYFKDYDVFYHCDLSILFDSFSKRENKKKEFRSNVPTLVLYSNVLIDNVSYNEIMKNIEGITSDTVILDKKKKKIGYYFYNFKLSNLEDTGENNNKIVINTSCVFDYIWELFDIIDREIDNDFVHCVSKKMDIKNELDKNIFISKTAKIGKGVVFDASLGKIIIDDNAVIMPLSYIQGPCYIGKNTIINTGAIIYKNCCFGPYCKIGGELETSIFQGYSNKQHYGFIGHSFVSEWVNIGAGTSNSDLKNNYSNIVIQLSEKKIETGKRFIGAMIGDHCKMAINSSLNTGTIIGICSNIAKTGLTEKYIPPFSWISNKGIEKYELQKVILTAKVVMNRRNKDITFEEQELITNCFTNRNI